MKRQEEPPPKPGHRYGITGEWRPSSPDRTVDHISIARTISHPGEGHHGVGDGFVWPVAAPEQAKHGPERRGRAPGFGTRAGGEVKGGMSHVDRFSVSLDTELLAAFDRHIAAKGYSNRSEAIRDLIRDLLATGKLEDDRVQVVAFVSLVCDGRAADAPGWLRSQLAKHADLVCASLRIPLRGKDEAESIALRGRRAKVQTFANELRARRGLTHVHLSMIPRESTAEEPASCSLKHEHDTEEE